MTKKLNLKNQPPEDAPIQAQQTPAPAEPTSSATDVSLHPEEDSVREAQAADLPVKLKGKFESLAKRAFQAEGTLLAITIRNDLQSSNRVESGEEYLPHMTYLFSDEEEPICNSEAQLEEKLEVALDRLSWDVAEALAPGAQITLTHNEVMGYPHPSE